MEHQYPGFRFFPIEEELVSFYLHNKLEGRRPDIDRVIPVVDIYDHPPSHLPRLAGEYCRGDTEQWFFFVPMQDREARGGRPNRLTNEGYWKATGSPGFVYSENRVIGVKRTMVFYRGRAPNGEKTSWKMNEYRAIDGQVSFSNPPQLRQELSLCRVYNGSKSVRAFDRRPPPAGAGARVHHRRGIEGTSGNHQQLPITISHDHDPSSSSLVQGGGAAAAGSSSATSPSTSSGEEGSNPPPPPPPPPPLPPAEAMEIEGSHSHSHSHVEVNFQNMPIWDFDEELNWI